MISKKRTYLAIVTMFISSLVLANDSDRLTKENISSKTELQIQARMSVLENRVKDIQKIDLSSLESAQRKELKKEVKEIKKEMGLDKKVSLSIGSIIIIVLLLIIIL